MTSGFGLFTFSCLRGVSCATVSPSFSCGEDLSAVALGDSSPIFLFFSPSFSATSSHRVLVELKVCLSRDCWIALDILLVAPKELVPSMRNLGDFANLDYMYLRMDYYVASYHCLHNSPALV